MKFITFERESLQSPGVWLDDGRVLDLHKALGTRTLLEFIEAGPQAVEAVRTLMKAPPPSALHAGAQVALLAPIPRPKKNVFAVGRNYSDHVAEGQKARGLAMALPEHPQFFTMPPTAVIGPGAGVRHDPKVSDRLDYEVELGVVLGTSARDIPAERAYDHVFGYTIINDVTARDVQRRHDQWFKGKGLDTFCPMGPWIVHRSAIADPQRLHLTMKVNGELRQSASTATMIFSVARIIESLSQGMTLEAGDVIATGTPSGVGYAMDPPRYLKPGDEMECRIDAIGTLVNKVVAARELD
jgi:2-keto-4-pentenoate hydratase/2-oxohepta-3-ene-1,7-dioic acid hydratase in catechol pathway